MSILFDDGSTENLVDTSNGPGVTGFPFTFGAWVKPDASVSNQVFIAISDTAGTVNYWAFRLNTTNNPVQCLIQSAAGTASVVSANSAWAENTWVHCCFTEATATSHIVFADGVAGTTVTTDRTPAGIDHFGIAAFVRTSAASHFSGRIFWPFVYNQALTADEVTLLSTGNSPLTVRREALVYFGRDNGANYLDIAGGNVMTVSGAATFSPDNPFQAQRVGQRGNTRSRLRLVA